MRSLISPRNIFVFGFLVAFYALLFKIQHERIGAFGCFDDCLNYTAAYFMTRGRVLYSQIFYNHQILMAYISFVVQSLLHPATIYQLLVYHRTALFLFSFLFGMLLIIRFRLAGMGFVVVYELIKYYLFGDRFLAESFIIYPLVYMTGLAWYKLQKKPLFSFELFAAAIMSWFVIFMREPYVPLALFLYFFILWKEKRKNIVYVSCAIFALLTVAILLSVPIGDYLFNVFTVNRTVLGETEVNLHGIFGEKFILIFLYPLTIFFWGTWNLFRIFLIGISVVFLASNVLWIKMRRSWKDLVILWFVLGLANIRLTPPGTLFYHGFHMLQWVGITIAINFFLLTSLYNKAKKATYVIGMSFLILFGFILFSPQSYLRDKVDRQAEFVTNYAPYLSNGFVIKTLAQPTDTLFMDHVDDLLYFETHLSSAYQYSWYYFAMPRYARYKDARLTMFAKTPPDFYFCDCDRTNHQLDFLPPDQEKNYLQVFFANKSTGLYVRRSKVERVPPEQWEKLKGYQYTLEKI